MITLEQVERLREKANVSFEEAKAALEATGGDLLDALIYLERIGCVAPPAGGGYYSSESAAPEEEPRQSQTKDEKKQSGERFDDTMKRFGRFCRNLVSKGNDNYLEAEKDGKVVFYLPVTVVAVLLVFLFWVVIPLFVISLFFGLRYHFRGNELGRDSVNRVMNTVSDTAEDIKRSVNGESR